MSHFGVVHYSDSTVFHLQCSNPQLISCHKVLQYFVYHYGQMVGQPRSEPALELHSRAVSSVCHRYVTVPVVQTQEAIPRRTDN